MFELQDVLFPIILFVGGATITAFISYLFRKHEKNKESKNKLSEELQNVGKKGIDEKINDLKEKINETIDFFVKDFEDVALKLEANKKELKSDLKEYSEEKLKAIEQKINYLEDRIKRNENAIMELNKLITNHLINKKND